MLTLKGAIMGFLLGLGFGIILFFGLFAIATYVLFALALMTMANKKGIENAWLAFLPIANMYILGKILGELDLFGNKIEQPEMVLPLITLASFALSGLGFIGSLVSLAVFVVTLIAYYQLVEQYKKGNGVLYVVLLVLLAPVGAYLFFSIRENEPTTVE